MNPTLILALLAMCAAGIGIVYWLYRIIQSQFYIEAVLSSTHEEVIDLKEAVTGMRSDVSEQLMGMEASSQKSFQKLVNAMGKAFEATGTLIADTSEGSAKDIQSIKVALASLRHDISLDAGRQEEIADQIKSAIHEDGKLTRKESQEIKTALKDDEKDDQRAKRKIRGTKKVIH